MNNASQISELDNGMTVRLDFFPSLNKWRVQSGDQHGLAYEEWTTDADEAREWFADEIKISEDRAE